MIDIAKGISFKYTYIFFPLDMVFPPIRPGTHHQIQYPPSNLVHLFPSRPCTLHGPSNFPSIGHGTPITTCTSNWHLV